MQHLKDAGKQQLELADGKRYIRWDNNNKYNCCSYALLHHEVETKQFDSMEAGDCYSSIICYSVPKDGAMQFDLIRPDENI